MNVKNLTLANLQQNTKSTYKLVHKGSSTIKWYVLQYKNWSYKSLWWQAHLSQMAHAKNNKSPLKDFKIPSHSTLSDAPIYASQDIQ